MGSGKYTPKQHQVFKPGFSLKDFQCRFAHNKFQQLLRRINFRLHLFRQLNFTSSVKKGAGSPTDPWFHWFPLPFFLSVAKQRDGRRSSCEKVSLWIRIVKHWAPRWGAAWTITAGAAADCAALKIWCAKVLSLQMCSWHITAGKLPTLNENPELLNSCWLDARHKETCWLSLKAHLKASSLHILSVHEHVAVAPKTEKSFAGFLLFSATEGFWFK